MKSCTTFPFAGIAPQDDATMDALAAKDVALVADDVGNDTPQSMLRWLNNDAYEYDLREMAYKDDDEFVTSDSDFAVYNETVGEHIGTVTDKYTLIEEKDIIGPASKAIRDWGLGDVTSGTIRQYTTGACADFYFDDPAAMFDSDIANDEHHVGLEVRWRHDGHESLRMRPFVRTGSCRNTMRHLGSEYEQSITHKRVNVDPAEIREQVYEMTLKTLFNIGYLASEFVEYVERAAQTTLDFEADPLTPYDAYRGLGAGKRMARGAACRAASRAGNLAVFEERHVSESSDILDRVDDDIEMTALDFINGWTWATKYVCNAADGQTLDSYHRTAHDLLSAPEERVEMALNDRRAELEAEADDTEEQTLVEQAAELGARIEH